jgi:hypothetical protein
MSIAPTAAVAMAATAEIGQAREELPDILAVPRVHADQVRDQIVLQISGGQRFPVVQGRVAQAVDALNCLDLERDIVFAGSAKEHFRIGNNYRPGLCLWCAD